MKLKALLPLCFFLCSKLLFAQEEYLINSSTIPVELLDNANAVVRLHEQSVTLESSKEMVVRCRRVITVYNSRGNRHINGFVHYDENVRIKSLEAQIFDAFGSDLKRIKKKDFKDVSAVEGGTLYSDSRIKYLNYTPITYPYTVDFTYEVETENTAFIPWFYPIDDFNLSIEKSIYHVNNPSGLELRYKEFNVDDFNISSNHNEVGHNYILENVKAIEVEDHSPILAKIVPKVLFASKTFYLEGVYGEVKDWKDFGIWMYDNLLSHRQNLPEETVLEIKKLTSVTEDISEKAKIVYKYVQDKTRYISVQVGIGGWKPFEASEVDRVSYGDCKGLTNYTMALLKAVGIESYYTVVSAGNSQNGIVDDFASIQGNHVILNLPIKEKTIWLECTNQKLPFGFIGDFTDDRDVLIIKPDGAVVSRTKKYTTEENLQVSKSICDISEDGNLDMQINMVSKGIQYDSKYGLDYANERDVDLAYKKRWSYLNNLEINNYVIKNDKNAVKFEEELKLLASNYGKIIGDRMLLAVNPSNRNTYVPNRYRHRKMPIVVHRGFLDRDEIEFHLPDGYNLEGLPEEYTLETKFGNYSAKLTKLDNRTVLYNRVFEVRDGRYSNKDYKAFRQFHKKVAQHDNLKISLIKIK